MYLKRLTLKNIKCFADATLSLPGEGGYAGWNVLLGVNSTGKSTVLQAAALALLGPVSGGRLLQQPASWVRQGQAFGEIQAEIAHNPELDYVSAGQQRRRSPYRARLIVSGHGRVELEDLELVQPQLALLPAVQKRLNAGPYSGRTGWFSTGYGPFRRLTGGGGEENLSILYGGGRDARHLTLFRESAALTNVERWLTDLHSRAVDPALPEPVKQAAQRDLDVTRELLRTLLPQGVVVEEVSSLGVTFRSPLGARVGLNQLSDGYRSFLALVIDLLKQLADSRSLGVTHDANGAPVIPAEGVVLIDEADTHLHPSWQRDLGFRLCAVFPKLQFIVTSHSPFVAQAARPDGLFLVRKDADGAVTITPSDRSVRGWRADQILLSDLFGLESTRDPETDALLAEHDSLTSLVAPDAAALARREAVRALLAERLTAPGDTLAERERSREMAALVEARLRRLRGDTP